MADEQRYEVEFLVEFDSIEDACNLTNPKFKSRLGRPVSDLDLSKFMGFEFVKAD